MIFFAKRNGLFAKGNGPNDKRNDLNGKSACQLVKTVVE